VQDEAVGPGWLFRPAKREPDLQSMLSPSRLGGEFTKATEERSVRTSEEAQEFGSQVHALLEHLPRVPKEAWREVASKVCQDSEIDEVLVHAGRILLDPNLAELFGPRGLAEVPVTAEIAAFGNRRISGVIDRLLISDERVLIVDFKTNAHVPESPFDVPAGILRQMGAYISAMEQIYTDRNVECAILWTVTGKFMSLPRDLALNSLADVEV